MEIILAEKAGFCFGVKRAIEMALSAAANEIGPKYTLGPLIHNPQFVEYLEKKGVKVADDIEEINNGVVIIRSHGVSKKIIDNLKEKNIKIIDATCPFVRKAQELAEELEKENYQLIIVGEKNHPEIIGIQGWLNKSAIIIKNSDELELYKDKIKTKIGIICQTTLKIETLTEVVIKILPLIKELKICNTICSATFERQSAAKELAEKVDCMIIIGGKNSSNTTKLAQICAKINPNIYHIETWQELKDIDKKEFLKYKKIGVSAGASTPDWIINEVIDFLEKIN